MPQKITQNLHKTVNSALVNVFRDFALLGMLTDVKTAFGCTPPFYPCAVEMREEWREWEYDLDSCVSNFHQYSST